MKRPSKQEIDHYESHYGTDYYPFKTEPLPNEPQGIISYSQKDLVKGRGLPRHQRPKSNHPYKPGVDFVLPVTPQELAQRAAERRNHPPREFLDSINDVIDPRDVDQIVALEERDNALYDRWLSYAQRTGKVASATSIHVEVSEEPSEEVEVHVA